MMEFIIVSNRGYWGKGATLLEAAQNCSIGNEVHKCYIYKIHERLISDWEIGSFGGLSWTWHEDFFKLLEDKRDYLKDIQDSITLGSFEVSVRAKKVILKDIEPN